MLSCREITQLVTEYTEKKLSLMKKLSFDMHVAMCSECRSYVDQMAETRTALGTLEHEQIPDNVMSALQGAFKDWHMSDEGPEPPKDDS